MSAMSVILPSFRDWGSRRGTFDERSPSIHDCEWRLETFVEHDAYPHYDAWIPCLGHVSITRRHIKKMNAAMRARSSSRAWDDFVDIALPELDGIPLSLDLIDGSDEEVYLALENLKSLVRRMTTVPGLTEMAVSKVLYLLRPRFITVSDSYVRDLLLLPDALYTEPRPECYARRQADVELCMRELATMNQKPLDALAAHAATFKDRNGAAVTLSKVRILDILLWTQLAVHRHGEWHQRYAGEVRGRTSA